MRKLAGSRPKSWGFLWVSLGLACLASACALRPPGFEAEPGTGPVMFRALSELPETPPAPQADMVDKAVQSLTADRAMATAAADALRREPFSQPDPAPPLSGF